MVNYNNKAGFPIRTCMKAGNVFCFPCTQPVKKFCRRKLCPMSEEVAFAQLSHMHSVCDMRVCECFPPILLQTSVELWGNEKSTHAGLANPRIGGLFECMLAQTSF